MCVIVPAIKYKDGIVDGIVGTVRQLTCIRGRADIVIILHEAFWDFTQVFLNKNRTFYSQICQDRISRYHS
jgi:hypothetical protein